ncbi:cytidine/deoxycytidylate deaminase [Nemania serpens]|nr:cytidine/deoxycytidylate deaminase [Nemania serpens]
MTAPHTFTPAELSHLRRTIELAAEALEAGDAPFGSVLTRAGGGSGPGTGTGVEEEEEVVEEVVLREDRNRIATMGDPTRHPEFELARWAATNMDSRDRAAATVYTSGEHCPMCAAAHAWVGIGRIVYVASARQLDGWMEELRREREDGEGEGQGKEGRGKGKGKGGSPVATLDVKTVAPGVEVLGPVPELEGEIKRLHRRYAGLG